MPYYTPMYGIAEQITELEKENSDLKKKNKKLKKKVEKLTNALIQSQPTIYGGGFSERM